MHEHSVVRTNCPWVSEGGKIVNLFQTLDNSSPKVNAFLQGPPALNNDACTSNMCSPHNKRYLAEWEGEGNRTRSAEHEGGAQDAFYASRSTVSSSSHPVQPVV